MPRKAMHDRDTLIDRAKTLFWRQGWAGTSLKDLERALNTKPGSFYAAFGSKDALYALTLERYADEGIARLKALEAEHGPLVALQQHLFLLVDNADYADYACLLAKTFLELSPKQHPLAGVADDLLRQMEAEFRLLFQAAQERGEIAADHDVVALARRYQSDLLSLRLLAARSQSDAQAVAREIAAGLAGL